MNNKGVSAVIGIILMIAIAIAITSTVYIYVDGILNTNEENIFVSGNVTKIEKIYSNDDIDYRITFDFNNTYLIGDSDFYWEIGKHYNMTLWRSDYFDCWFVKEYVLTVEKIN